MFGFLFTAVVLVMIAMVAMKVVPAYIQFFSVKKVLAAMEQGGLEGKTNAEIRKALTQWIDGTLFPDEPMALQDLYHMLLMGDYGGMPDAYFVLMDFGSYSMANRRMMEDYKNREVWLKKAITNVAQSGFFSSDRTIREYAHDIWGIKPVPPK